MQNVQEVTKILEQSKIWLNSIKIEHGNIDVKEQLIHILNNVKLLLIGKQENFVTNSNNGLNRYNIYKILLTNFEISFYFGNLLLARNRIWYNADLYNMCILMDQSNYKPCANIYVGPEICCKSELDEEFNHRYIHIYAQYSVALIGKTLNFHEPKVLHSVMGTVRNLFTYLLSIHPTYIAITIQKLINNMNIPIENNMNKSGYVLYTSQGQVLYTTSMLLITETTTINRLEWTQTTPISDIYILNLLLENKHSNWIMMRLVMDVRSTKINNEYWECVKAT